MDARTAALVRLEASQLLEEYGPLLRECIAATPRPTPKRCADCPVDVCDGRTCIGADEIRAAVEAGDINEADAAMLTRARIRHRDLLVGSSTH